MALKHVSLPYFTLEEPRRADEYLYDLLGRVVTNPYRPLDDICPLLPKQNGPDLSNIVPNLYPQPEIGQNLKKMRDNTYNAEVRTRITNFFNAFLKSEASETPTLEAACFRRFTMVSLEYQLRQLLEDPVYGVPVIEKLRNQKSKKLAMISSVITCGSLKVGRTTKDGIGGGAELKGREPHSGQEVSLKAEATQNRMEELSGEYKDDVIIAVGCFELELKEPTQGFLGRLISYFKPSDEVVISQVPLHPLSLIDLANHPMQGDTPRLLGSRAGNIGTFNTGNKWDIEPDEEEDEETYNFTLY